MKAGNSILPARKSGLRAWLFRLSVFAVIGISAPAAMAHTKTHHAVRHVVAGHHHVAAKRGTHENLHKIAIGASRHISHRRFVSSEYRSKIRLAHDSHHRAQHRVALARYHHSWLQCVPYAREVSHIDLSGDAFLWWAEASGRYARGNTPVEGAVLNFRPIRRMPLGHVAVVTSVINNRTILVTQANWVRGTITNDVTMQDVSPNNDWTQVQVELGDSTTWGAAYPTYGFIYNQAADRTVIAANGQGNEVAEAPAATPVSLEAPDRNLQ